MKDPLARIADALERYLVLYEKFLADDAVLVEEARRRHDADSAMNSRLVTTAEQVIKRRPATPIADDDDTVN
jgi:hypothetical protein